MSVSRVVLPVLESTTPLLLARRPSPTNCFVVILPPRRRPSERRIAHSLTSRRNSPSILQRSTSALVNRGVFGCDTIESIYLIWRCLLRGECCRMTTTPASAAAAYISLSVCPSHLHIGRLMHKTSPARPPGMTTLPTERARRARRGEGRGGHTQQPSNNARAHSFTSSGPEYHVYKSEGICLSGSRCRLSRLHPMAIKSPHSHLWMTRARHTNGYSVVRDTLHRYF